MENQSRLFAALVFVIAIGFGLVLLQPVVEEQLAPDLVTAWVAIEPKTSGLAEIGPVKLAADTPFKLHAVLEARDRNGQPVYYTTAPGLAIEGKAVAVQRLKVWDRPQPIKVRWFTVEGRRPYMALDAQDGLGSFEFQEFLRSDWPLSWSVPGEIDSAHDNHLEDSSVEKLQRFGTQRYHVRIELYRDDKSLIPEQVVRSWGIGDLKQQIERFPTVRMTLPGPAGPASRVFGLTQLDPATDSSSDVLDQISELAANDVAFSDLTVLGDQIRQVGKALGDLPWQSLDLAGQARWGEDVGPGDLLRVGDRVVVLYADQGTPGVVDYQDLCFDYVQGAAVRLLSDVFVGSGNIVQLASLGGAEAMRHPS